MLCLSSKSFDKNDDERTSWFVELLGSHTHCVCPRLGSWLDRGLTVWSLHVLPMSEWVPFSFLTLATLSVWNVSVCGRLSLCDEGVTGLPVPVLLVIRILALLYSSLVFFIINSDKQFPTEFISQSCLTHQLPAASDERSTDLSTTPLLPEPS